MSLVIVILGPTASGKTKLSIELAKRLGGEIISADSMQVYKYMNIGTAKPDESEKQGIPHYLMDEIFPNEEFSVACFQERALQYIDQIDSKGKIPMVVGGTGLYINSLLYNISFSESVGDWALREALQKEAEEKGNTHLHNRLRAIDPEAADRIHENNVKRVIRAIEVFECTQKPMSYHLEKSLESPSKHQFIVLGIIRDREKLYERINLRVEEMFEQGLIEEVKTLKKMGYHQNTIAMQGLGYKEVLSYINGEITLEEVKYILQRDTRHYAKRQITWFKRMKEIYWLHADESRAEQEIIEEAYRHIQEIIEALI